MRLHDSPMLSFNRPPPVHTSMGQITNSLQLDPWLTSPLSSATPVQCIPGFMGPAQALQPSYPSHGFLNSAPHAPHPHAHPHPPSGQGMQSMAPPPYQCPAPYSDKFPLEDVDQRCSSIAALRMKAKEHIQSMDKTWQPMWLIDRPCEGQSWHKADNENSCHACTATKLKWDWAVKTEEHFWYFLFFLTFFSSPRLKSETMVRLHYWLPLLPVDVWCLGCNKCRKTNYGHHSLHPRNYCNSLFLIKHTF